MIDLNNLIYPKKTSESKLTPEQVRKCLSVSFDGAIQTIGSGSNAQKYLSWPTVFNALMLLDPNFEFRVIYYPGPVVQSSTGEKVPGDSEFMLPYLVFPDGSVMVATGITLFGVERVMQLPLMDAQGKSATKVDAREISDTIQRCFVKTAAMFGVGLDLYKKNGVSTPIVLDDDAPRSSGASESASAEPQKTQASKPAAAAPAAATTKAGDAAPEVANEVAQLQKSEAFLALPDNIKRPINSFFKGDAAQYKKFVEYINTLGSGDKPSLSAETLSMVLTAAKVYAASKNPALVVE